MKKGKAKLVVFVLFFLCTTTALANADPIVVTLLTTRGIDGRGYPVDYQRYFSSKEAGVQLYLEWHTPLEARNISVKWFDEEGFLIQHLDLQDFSGYRLYDYISFEDFSPNQIVIPKKPGKYHIIVYIEGQIHVRTWFIFL